MSFTVIRGSVEPSSIDGMGFFARQDIRKGDLVGIFDGIVKRFRITGKGAAISEAEDVQAIDLAVDSGWLYVLVPFKQNDLSGVDYINHSCTPNCLVENYLKIVAGRNISRGEELTIDYGPLTLVKENKRCKCHPGCSFIL